MPTHDEWAIEIGLIERVEINVDYILMLVENLRATHGDGDDKELRADIARAVDASPSLRNKRDLIGDFVNRVSSNGAIDDEWRAFISAKREAELDAIFAAEGLRADAAREFIETVFRDGALRATATAITKVVPPASRLSEDGGHGAKKQRVIEKLGAYFERSFGLANGARE